MKTPFSGQPSEDIGDKPDDKGAYLRIKVDDSRTGISTTPTVSFNNRDVDLGGKTATRIAGIGCGSAIAIVALTGYFSVSCMREMLSPHPAPIPNGRGLCDSWVTAIKDDTISASTIERSKGTCEPTIKIPPEVTTQCQGYDTFLAATKLRETVYNQCVGRAR